MPFQSLGLDVNILKAVQESGYTEPTPIQAAAIPQILAGHDLVGIAQTGTGKTAAFTLPILTKLAAPSAGTAPLAGAAPRGTRALVLAPTRELAVQIEENVRGYAKYLPLRIASIFGGVGEHHQIQALRNGAQFIIACPGRLLDLVGRRHADFSGLQYLVLDEADRMLDMGFIPAIRQIVKSLPQRRQTLLFCATLSKEIETLTHQFQRAPKVVQIGKRSNPAATVMQIVYEVPKHLKSALLVHLLKQPGMNMVLVFSRMKHGADRIARHLEMNGVRAATLHANRSQSQRLKALKDFKSGAVRVLVATDIASRGIDVDGISHVINFDFPMHAEDYVHRIGRTGRAQAVGDAISFVSSEDHAHLRSLERFIGRGIVRKRAEGFDYAASAPPMSAGGPHPRDRAPSPAGGHRPSGQRPSSHSSGPSSGHSSHSSRPSSGPSSGQSSGTSSGHSSGSSSGRPFGRPFAPKRKFRDRWPGGPGHQPDRFHGGVAPSRGGPRRPSRP